MTGELRCSQVLTLKPSNGNALHLPQCSLCRSFQLPALNELHERQLWGSRRGKLSSREQAESGLSESRHRTSLSPSFLPITTTPTRATFSTLTDPLRVIAGQGPKGSSSRLTVRRTTTMYAK